MTPSSNSRSQSQAMLTIVGITFVGLIGWKLWPVRSVTSVETNAGQQVCPEAWYEDQMPSITPDGKPAAAQNQYFIVDGKRVEFSALDVNWIKQHCPTNKPEVIQ